MHARRGAGMKLMSWAAAGGAAAWAAARLAGADGIRRLEAPAAALMSFTPQVTTAALLGSPLLRRRGPAVTAAAAGAALAAAVLPRAIARPQPRAGGPALRVLTANLMAGRAAEATVTGLVRRRHVDVLFLQELTVAAAGRLRRAGLGDLLPHGVTDARRDGPRGSAIFARFPLAGGLRLAASHHAQPTARLDLPSGQAVELVCVHLRAPSRPSSPKLAAQWRKEMAALPAPADPPRVLAGDFNATADHARFRGLLRTGHVDAAAATGLGLVPTWGPPGWPVLLTLDHVLVDPRCAVLATSVHHLPGSDHRAVWAEFRLPG